MSVCKSSYNVKCFSHFASLSPPPVSLSLSPFLLQLATLTNKLVVISSSQLPSIMTPLAMVSLSNSLLFISSSGAPIDRNNT